MRTTKRRKWWVSLGQEGMVYQRHGLLFPEKPCFIGRVLVESVFVGNVKRATTTMSAFISGSSRCHIKVAIGPAPHKVSRADRARNPRRVRKEYPGPGPQKSRKSAPGDSVSNESEKSPKVRFETAGRTLSGLLEPWPEYSFRTLFGLFRGPCVGLKCPKSGLTLA